MIRLLPLFLVLAACGVDGAPVRPSDVGPREDREPSSAIIVTGSAALGVSRRF